MDKKRAEQLVGIGCIVCLLKHDAYTEPCVHHLTGIKYRATGKKASDKHTIPLCHEHHQGRAGIHTVGMRPWEAIFGSQGDLLDITNSLIPLGHRERTEALEIIRGSTGGVRS